MYKCPVAGTDWGPVASSPAVSPHWGAQGAEQVAAHWLLHPIMATIISDINFTQYLTAERSPCRFLRLHGEDERLPMSVWGLSKLSQTKAGKSH